MLAGKLPTPVTSGALTMSALVTSLPGRRLRSSGLANAVGLRGRGLLHPQLVADLHNQRVRRGPRGLRENAKHPLPLLEGEPNHAPSHQTLRAASKPRAPR